VKHHFSRIAGRVKFLITSITEEELALGTTTGHLPQQGGKCHPRPELPTFGPGRVPGLKSRPASTGRWPLDKTGTVTNEPARTFFLSFFFFFFFFFLSRRTFALLDLEPSTSDVGRVFACTYEYLWLLANDQS
jgi:hypothetical protein